jgi:tight adherence protein B
MNDAILRFIIMIGIFGAVALLAQAIITGLLQNRQKSSAVNKRLQMIERGVDRETVTTALRKASPHEIAGLPKWMSAQLMSIRRMLNAANIGMSANALIGIMAVATGLIMLLVLIVATFSGFALTIGMIQVALIFALCLAVAIPLVVISRIAQKRRQKMEAQFPVALDIFVRGLRSGHPIPAAIDLLTHEMEDPIGTEFGIVQDEISYGFDLRDALFRMADRWGLADMHMFVVSVSVQMETGGNLAEILENLSGVIRERASMYMKVRALSSEGRMTAVILTLLPILAFVGLFLSNPEFYLDVAQDPMFTIGFVGLLLLYAIGFFTIRKMIDLKV